MSMSSIMMTSVSKFYLDVVDDVINGMKEEFADEGLDANVLDELKKLWEAKLSETRVFDPEPMTNTAAQYASLLQRSQYQVRPPVYPMHKTAISANPSVTTPVSSIRQLGPLFRANSSVATDPSSLANSGRLPILRPAAIALSTTQSQRLLQPQPHQAVNTISGPTAILPAQTLQPATVLTTTDSNGMGATLNLGTINAVTSNQAITGVGATSTTSQFAALPSGLTGHLVQIGQQTYLLPQSMINFRQTQSQLTQLVGQTQQPGGAPSNSVATTIIPNPGPGNSAMNLSIENGSNMGSKNTTFVIADPSTFRQTQVDGGHDSDDEDGFAATPASLQQPVGSIGRRQSDLTPSGKSPIRRSMAHGDSDLDEDDDDDDEDLVPATPGLTPLSPALGRYHLGGGLTPRRDAKFHPPGLGTPMGGMTPGTPVTPLSAAQLSHPHCESGPRQTPGSGPMRKRTGPPTSLGTPKAGKRRRRSAYGADTDTEMDDDFEDEEYDIGEEAEIMTATTMTPAGHRPGIGDEDDDYDAPDTLASPLTVRPGVSRKAGTAKAGRRLPYAKMNKPDASSMGGGASGRSSTDPNLSPAHTACADDFEAGENEEGAEEEEEEEEEEEPLNSEDDVSDEEPEILFESDNVVVCQYDKIHRSRNKWRFHLKDGIMAIKGRDHVFQKAIGEAEW